MRAAGLCFCSMPQALNYFVASDKKPIVVTGTHGKTTTASLAAWLLFKAGLDPSFMIGGILKNFGSNYRLGAGEHIVLEGDEYDTAFFDKGPKFLHYRPYLAILTSVEFDHADIFRDLAHVKEVFRLMVSRMPGESVLLAYDDDADVRGVLRHAAGSVVFYGRRPDSFWRLAAERVEPPQTVFEVTKDGAPFASFRTPMVGRHNTLNALSTVAAADHLGISPAAMGEALASFEGVRRRQEVRGCKNGVTVMDDFAHHPTAVRETIAAVRPFYPAGRLIAVFEPRTNTSMRRVFQDVYPQCFDGADLVCIRRPPLLKKIPEAERFSSEKLVADLNKNGRRAYFFPETDAIIDFLARETRAGDVVLIMSNGGFDDIHEKLLQRL
jgi:UDP-N-acetylmuramate: L-alanyl-gamma-D-glutamyl-meso-diaminopimelate ligase